jgi:hypothetical protein
VQVEKESREGNVREGVRDRTRRQGDVPHLSSCVQA